MPGPIITVESLIERTPRVQQVEAMFDVPPSKQASRSWEVELPVMDDPDWRIGLIVGPSGSGKTSIARALFGDRLIREHKWPKDRSILDGFPEGVPIKQLVGALTSVGFGSPPSWLQPYRTLSTGEQFRATLARAIVETPADGFCAIDEFTSTVDRQVAKVASHAVAKAIRRDDRARLVAVSCHYDIVDWLQPDWVYQTHLAKLTRRRLRRRPPVRLDIYPVSRAIWPVFRHHHYLSAELASAAQCFGAYVGDECVAFTSYLHFPQGHGATQVKKGHRLVVLPDWQGLGIGGILDDWLGEKLWHEGFEYRNTVAHPAMIAYYAKSPRWQAVGSGAGPRGQLHTARYRRQRSAGPLARRNMNPRTLSTYTFSYVPLHPFGEEQSP